MLFLSAQELGRILIERMRKAGVVVREELCLQIPNLPAEILVSVGTCAPHVCEHERSIEIPAALVVDAQVPVVDSDGRIMGVVRREKPAAPYWLLGVNLGHDFVPYPREPWRLANQLEAALVLAQFPRCGSVQMHDGQYWGHSQLQAFLWNRERVVLAGWGIPSYNHHTARVRAVHCLVPPEGGLAFEAANQKVS